MTVQKQIGWWVDMLTGVVKGDEDLLNWAARQETSLHSFKTAGSAAFSFASCVASDKCSEWTAALRQATDICDLLRGVTAKGASALELRAKWVALDEIHPRLRAAVGTDFADKLLQLRGRADFGPWQRVAQGNDQDLVRNDPRIQHLVESWRGMLGAEPVCRVCISADGSQSKIDYIEKLATWEPFDTSFADSGILHGMTERQKIDFNAQLSFLTSTQRTIVLAAKTRLLAEGPSRQPVATAAGIEMTNQLRSQAATFR